MEPEKLEACRKEIRIIRFGGGYDAKNLLPSIKNGRLYEGIDWSKQDIQDRSCSTVELAIFEISVNAFPEEVVRAVRLQFPLLKKPPKELGLCLLKRFPRKNWEPPWVLLHEPIRHPEKEFAHVSTLSGSRLSGTRVGNKKQFHKDCLFVFIGGWE
jgi:hypothetical protein